MCIFVFSDMNVWPLCTLEHTFIIKLNVIMLIFVLRTNIVDPFWSMSIKMHNPSEKFGLKTKYNKYLECIFDVRCRARVLLPFGILNMHMVHPVIIPTHSSSPPHLTQLFNTGNYRIVTFSSGIYQYVSIITFFCCCVGPTKFYFGPMHRNAYVPHSIHI